MLEQTWGTGELIDQLVAIQQAFGYAGLSGPTPLLDQVTASSMYHMQPTR